MCEPVSLSTLFYTSLAMSAATSAAGLVGQAQQYSANKANAEQAFRVQDRQTNLSVQQQEAADAKQAQQSQIEMLKSAATARASAGEAGVIGNSVDALIGDYYASEGRYLNSLATQGRWNRAQADLQKRGQAATAQGRINSVAKPDFIGAALRIGGDALDKHYELFDRPAFQRRV